MAGKGKSLGKRSKKDATGVENEGSTRVSILMMFEYLRSLNFTLDQSFYDAKLIPTGQERRNEEGKLEPWNVRATKALLDKVESQLPYGSESHDRWKQFRANYKATRRSLSRQELLEEVIQRKVSQQAATGYYIRVPYMDVFLGMSDKESLLNMHMDIKYHNDKIVITKSFST